MLARYAVLPASPPSSGPKQLLFYKFSYPVTSVKSTLLQVFSLKNLKPSGINTYEKQGEGWWLWLTKCSKKVSGGKVRWNPNLPFSVHTSKFRIPQLLCLPLLCEFCIPVVLAGRKHRGVRYSSHSGTTLSPQCFSTSMAGLSSTGAAMISRTRSRSAGTSSLLSPFVSMVSCR